GEDRHARPRGRAGARLPRRCRDKCRLDLLHTGSEIDDILEHCRGERARVDRARNPYGDDASHGRCSGGGLVEARQAGGSDDTLEIAAGTFELRVAREQLPELATVAEHEQVAELVEKHVVDDVIRHAHHSPGQPDGAVDRGARAPQRLLIVDPAHRRRLRATGEIPRRELGGSAHQLVIAAVGALLPGTTRPGLVSAPPPPPAPGLPPGPRATVPSATRLPGSGGR